ncbi:MULTISPECIES: hypothetical protein [unclassified Crossiella]|uniref:hypothetical protein n=1 Tax=unclassified Crossiella TaxID=2620835 RepID=UPI00200011F4|nr:MULTISPECIES: hypothetical protein [unclassified Crossiella]MCK2238661.1 hypothetical protein [Crossiella sp. S99.2]MCK2251769.1 hypothetical protein [Crossiella sp. S99.1]
MAEYSTETQPPGLAPPDVSDWTEVRTGSVSCDHVCWYLPTSAAGGRALGAHAHDGENLGLLHPAPSVLATAGGFGAPVSHRGHLDVPVTGPAGIWRLRPDGTGQSWLPAKELPEEGLFTWCGNQLGLLYTSATRHPRTLRAYDPTTLSHLPYWDIDLGPSPLPLTDIRGGVFTPNRRLLLVGGGPEGVNTLACFDLVQNPRHHRRPLSARCSGARLLPEITGEIAGLAIRPVWIGDTYAPVHILSTAGFPAHSFRVPDPDNL